MCEKVTGEQALFSSNLIFLRIELLPNFIFQCYRPQTWQLHLFFSCSLHFWYSKSVWVGQVTLSCKGPIPIYYSESESRCLRIYCCIPKENLTLMSNLWKARVLSIVSYAATSPNSSFHSFKHFTVKLPQWSQVRSLQRIELLKKGGWWSSTKNFVTTKGTSKRRYPVRLKSMYHRPSLKFKYLKK